MEFIGFGALVALGFLLLAFKLGMTRVLGYDLIFDVIITSSLMASLAGTFAGMSVALMGGLITSLALIFLKKLFGYDRLMYKADITGVKRWRWIHTPGRLS